MTIKKQVTSLEISKRLKELGVDQFSLFWWVYVNHSDRWELDAGTDDYHHFPLNDCTDCSAFTVSELGEILPEWIEKEGGLATEKWQAGVWKVSYLENEETPHIEKWSETEADARGLMLIHLLENKLITL